MKTIYSEDPENDIWRELLKYTYNDNIKNYKKENEYSEDAKNAIIGSINQAYEYFRFAKEASIQISPLLLYYGLSNLLYGVVYLNTNEKPIIENHGMHIKINKSKNMIGNTLVKFDSPLDGAVHVFARAFGFKDNLASFCGWNLKEFVDSVAEVCEDYNSIYSDSYSNILFLDLYNTPTGRIARVYIDDSEQQILDLFSKIDLFDNTYLKTTKGKDIISNKEFFILRQKPSSNNIYEMSFNGQPYLRAGHMKGNTVVTLPPVINMFVILFILASLCRYYPEKWTPFILEDNTGERLLIDKLLYYIRRIAPNYVLNYIKGEDVIYTSNKYSEKNTIKFLGEYEINELIEKESRKQASLLISKEKTSNK